MRRLQVTCTILAGILLLAIGPSAQGSTSPSVQESTSSTTPKIDVSKLGPQVGDRVPDFSLRDQNGRTQNVQSIMGAKGAMLVFFRSADW